MKTVSFVVPVYNPPLDLFRGQLDSLLDQSGVGLEIVAVNDGSTNGAPGVLREYEAEHPGVFRIIDRENRGAGPSRNEGFLATTGDYVWFVDADDAIRPDCLRELVAAMEETGADQMLLNSMVADPGSYVPFPDRKDECIQEVSRGFAFANMYRAPWKRLLRRDFLARIGVSFCDARTGQEDQPETARWTLESERLFYANKVWYKWHRVGSSLTHGGIRPQTVASSLQVCDLFRELGARFPDDRGWMDFFGYLVARNHIWGITETLKRMARTGGDPAVMDELRAVREAYKEKLAALPSDRPLVWLFDKGGRVGESRAKAAAEAEAARKVAALERKLSAAERKAAAFERKLSAAERKAAAFERKAGKAERRIAAIQSSLSWRATAPVRLLVGMFGRKSSGPQTP